MEKNKNTPEKKFSTGVISATVWKNKGTRKDGTPAEYNTISLQRSYQDKKGEWQYTNSFRINDLPKAALVLNKAYEYLVIKERVEDYEADIENVMVVEDVV